LDIRETGILLAKMSLIDNRQASVETIRVWQEILADTKLEDAMEALMRHWRTSDQYIRPVHIVEGARLVANERRKITYGQ
jgi:hypothetical protein